IVPLSGDNRILAALGLKQIKRKPRLGIKVLLQFAKIDHKNLTSQHIGFGIAPRLNAAGRMDSAKDAFRLLTTEDMGIAKELAYRLDSANRERQAIEARILKEAKSLIEPSLDRDTRTIVLKSSNWHAGIIGIVASKLVDKYNRPVILLTQAGNGLYTGSCRSIEGFNIYEALCSMKDIIKNFGGHEQAAGLTIERENIKALIDNFEAYGKSHIKEDMLIQEYKYDLIVDNSDISFELYDELQRLEPFGEDNQMPVFLVKKAYIDGYRAVGKRQNHIQLSIALKERMWEGIWFNSGNSRDNLDIKPCVDLLMTLDKNEWNGLTKLQFNIRHIKMRTDDDMFIKRAMGVFYHKFFDDFYRRFLYNKESDSKSYIDISKLGLKGKLNLDEAINMLNLSTGGNLILVGDRDIAYSILTKFAQIDILKSMEFGYRALMPGSGRGTDGLVILPDMSSSIVNEYENIFIISGDQVMDLSCLIGFKNKLWVIESGYKSEFLKQLYLTREDFACVYLWLKKIGQKGRSSWDSILATLERFNRQTKGQLNYFQFNIILAVFQELNFLDITRTFRDVKISLNLKPDSRELDESILYCHYSTWLSNIDSDIYLDKHKEVK
ncbi:MAG: hypothetical protein GX974_05780, partial [Clostridiales bacterium]|nr:hypothetical protein [Clostridiales bacterium]